MPFGSRWFRWAKHPPGPLSGAGLDTVVSAAQSSLVASAFAATANGSTATTLTGTWENAAGDPLAGKSWSLTFKNNALVSAGNSTVNALPGSIANDGVDSCVCEVTVVDTDGIPVVGLPASVCVLAVSGTGNTVTQPSGVTDFAGRISGSFVSTVAASKTVSWTIMGLAVTATSSVTVTGGAITYPNEPAGYTRFAETDYSAQPANPLPVDGGGQTLESPTTNITIEATPTRLRYHHIAGTAPGYSPPSYALFSMWDTADQLSSTEYSEVYFYHEVKLVGNGGTYETPAGPGFKFLGYFGVANNNQNPATGPGAVQAYTLARPVSVDTSSPYQASEFYFDMYTQMTGTSPGNRSMPQNENTGTHLIVGTQHTLEIVARLNTPGSADGVLQWWIDDVRVGNYTDVRWIDSSYANYGSTGLSGFFGMYMDAVWGGSGGASKTRDDSTDWYKTYISGVFLRAADPF